MALVHSGGISVRHAIARALATSNQSPVEATWALRAARATVDARGRILRADVSVEILRPGGTLEPGVVNPDGAHPLMAGLPGQPDVLLDVLPVTWDRWVRVRPGVVPGDLDPWCPRVGVSFEDAAAFAAACAKRLPTLAELRAAWGHARFPWGDEPDPSRGAAAPARWGELPEVGRYPPNAAGFFDLGCGLWQFVAEGAAVGGAPGLVEAPPDARPTGFRCAADRR